MLQNTLTTIDEQIKRLRPAYYDTLQPGLSMDEITTICTTYNIILPEDIISLYKRKNGQIKYASFVNNSCFLPLAKVLENAKVMTDMMPMFAHIPHRWSPTRLPLFENGNGSAICYDIAGIQTGYKGQIIQHRSKQPKRTILYPSLASFFDAIQMMYTYPALEELEEPYDLIDYTKQPDGFPIDLLPQ